MLGNNDPTMKKVVNIVNQAECAGGYKSLSDNVKSALVAILAAHHKERDTGIVQWPMQCLHNIRTSLERIKGEVHCLISPC